MTDQKNLLKLFDVEAEAYSKGFKEGQRIRRMGEGDFRDADRHAGGLTGEECAQYRAGLWEGHHASVQIEAEEWSRLIEAIERVTEGRTADWRDREHLVDVLDSLMGCRHIRTTDWQKRRYLAGDGPDPDADPADAS